MATELGVSLEQCADAVIVSYQKGIQDSIDCLKHFLDTLDVPVMKKEIIKSLQQTNSKKVW
jgi:hypothetical protein